jgi:hypothetical protein
VRLYGDVQFVATNGMVKRDGILKELFLGANTVDALAVNLFSMSVAFGADFGCSFRLFVLGWVADNYWLLVWRRVGVVA